MKTEIQNTELYKKFKEALNIEHDMRPDDNPFVVACCEIAKEYASQSLPPVSEEEIKEANELKKEADDLEFIASGLAAEHQESMRLELLSKVKVLRKISNDVLSRLPQREV